MPDVPPLVLDTHAWIWLVDGNPQLSDAAKEQIDVAAVDGKVLVPAICVWEVAKLEGKGRLILASHCRTWIDEALSQPGIRLVPLTAEIALESCFLPGSFHQDPADRFIVATARIEKARIVSRDTRLLKYAEQGYVSVVSA
ncbi:MAG TPA: type II toxin-antitoxin system VapC family toxin [Candidatus Obscuribacterales bacterium]